MAAAAAAAAVAAAVAVAVQVGRMKSVHIAGSVCDRYLWTKCCWIAWLSSGSARSDSRSGWPNKISNICLIPGVGCEAREAKEASVSRRNRIGNWRDGGCCGCVLACWPLATSNRKRLYAAAVAAAVAAAIVYLILLIHPRLDTSP